MKPGETTGGDTLRLHLERYVFAAENLKPGRLLDIACGVGYGTEVILSRRDGDVAEIVAVDNDAGAIDYGRKTYANPKVRFLQSDAYAFHDAIGFSTIVSLETIEHLPDPQKFATSIDKCLQPGGRWVCSAPVTPTKDAIPFHLNDFTEASYRRIFLTLGYREVGHLLQVQSYNPVRVMSKREERMEGLRKNLPLYYARHPGSLIDRLLALFQYGFNNHYLTVAWQKPG